MGISDGTLAVFGEFVSAHLGLHFPPERQRDLERGALAACREFGRDDPEECVRWLMTPPLDQARMEALAGNLTVGETYFFREWPTFDLLQRRLLPKLIAARRSAGRRLRIWSAGCSSGEEPYSVAVLLRELLPDLAEWNVTILGTDINQHALRKAVAGVYREWSFRSAPPWLKERYVRATGNNYAIAETIRQMVSFAYHNLAKDPYPSVANNTNAMDIILCRNVLMYFTPDVARRVIEGFHRCLLDGGWLIVSPGEANPDLFPGFERVAWPDVVLFRRLPAEVAVPAAPPAWQPAGVPEELEAACDDLATVILPPVHPFDRALGLYQQGHYGEAEELLKTIDEPRASALLAKVYANRGELAEALGWCEKALAHDRLSAACHYLRGSILQELGRIGDAVDALKRTLYLDQSFVPAYVALGRLSQRQGQRQEAERYFRSALAMLRTYPRDQSLPELDGMTAGRLAEAIQAAQSGSRA